jgi:hypothetical protein
MLRIFVVSLCLAVSAMAAAKPQSPKGIPWPGGVWPNDGKEYPAGSFNWIKQADWDRYVAAKAKWDKEHPQEQVVAKTGIEALDEVNAARASRGLPPFQYDERLTHAARACAQFRADRLIHGHTSNDFAFVPAGSYAPAAGCAAWEPSWGWGSCCTYDRYSHAGAAYAMGTDGRRYMHLFVR